MSSDLGVHSPLLDLFVRGDMPLDVKLLAAAGQMAPLAIEQVALIALMADDADPLVARTAREAVSALPVAGVSELMARSSTPEGLRAWLTSHGFTPSAPADTSAEPLPAFVPGEVVPDGGDGAPAVAAVAAAIDGAAAGDDAPVQMLSSLSVPTRIKMAMLGSREQRAVLVRDPNRVVSSAVLSSPKLSETEVENFSRMTNVAADVLRIIGTNRSWTRSYGIVSALVRNPRTPPAISLGFVTRLQERDLKTLAVDRNIPEALRAMARKSLQAKESRRS